MLLNDLKLLKKLCNASGPSGYEGEVRKIIIDEIKEYVDEVKVDNIGNIIAHKKGNGHKVLVAAHMDEVGFIVTGFNKDGTIRFRPLGGINSKVAPCKVVYIGDKRITGVIGLKAIHLQSKEEREQNLTYNDYCIDIGSNCEKLTRESVKLGEYVVFSTEFSEFGDGLVKGKAFDDRMGCAVLIEVLKEKYECDFYAAFNIQEEVGERGAFISAYDIQPEIGIVLEGTICADMPNVPKHLMATTINGGPAISMMDSTSIFDKELTDSIIKVAEEDGIPYQRRRATAGSNDAGAMVTTGKGSKVVTVSVPCRYIHSSISVASINDYLNTIELMKKYIKSIK